MPQGPPAQPVADLSIMLQKFAGLRNTVTAERLGPDELERATNVDLDDAGQIHRRRGFTRVVSGNFHSLFRSAAGVVYGVKDGALGIIHPDYSFVSLQSGIGSDPIAYVEVGSKIYFSSLMNSGAINTAVNAVGPWGAPVSAGQWISPVVNPSDTLPPLKGRLLGAPPLATALTSFNGRIYLANDVTVWATMLYQYDYVDKTRGYWQFESPVTGLGAVTDGIYVGTTSAVYFVGGTFNEPNRIPVMSVGMLPGSLVPMPSELVNPEVPLNQAAPAKDAVMFMTDAGVCAGLDGGRCFNLTQTKMIFPDAVLAAAMFRRQDGINSYVGVLDSKGSPQGAMRLGDYVSAEIVRACDVIPTS